MRITVPEEIMRLTVPTCTPSRDKPLVIVSSLELGGAGLHIFVSVVAVLLEGCLRDSLQEHHRPTDLAQAVGAEVWQQSVVLLQWHFSREPPTPL